MFSASRVLMCIRKAERGGRESIWMSVSHTGHILDFKRQDENEKDTLTLSDENRAEMETSAKALTFQFLSTRDQCYPLGWRERNWERHLRPSVEACHSIACLPALREREKNPGPTGPGPKVCKVS